MIDEKKTRVDVELATLIHNALVHDDRLSADSIDVTVVDRMATLSGMVQSYRRKSVAIDIAESMHGCRGVVDKLVVSPPGVQTDDDVADNVRMMLDAHADVTKEVITVSVKAGVVTLRGHVASRWERELAGDVALGARGVRDIQNLLLVDLDRKIEDEALTSSIQHAISRTSGLQNTNIRVAVHANTAVLSGAVSAPWQRRKAESVSSRFRITEIVNEIVVPADAD